MELYAGTGGYSNPDWVGQLYPPDARKETWLSIYAQHYNAVEINASFYAIPGQKAFSGMLARSQGRVRFAVKLHQSMTHQRNATPQEVERLLGALEPLRQAGVLGPLLAQFPQSFHRTPENRRYLAQLAAQFADPQQVPGGLAVEFRHQSWDRPEVIQAFEQAGLIWVSPDYPPLPGLPTSHLQITSGVAYIRLSGRNTRTWWEGKDQSERHDYLYTPQELDYWVKALHSSHPLPAQAWVIFNNTTRGQALTDLGYWASLWAPYSSNQAG